MTIQLLKQKLTDLGYGNQLKEPKALKNQIVEIVPENGRIETYNALASKLIKEGAIYQPDPGLVGQQIGRSYKSSAGAVIFPKSRFGDLAIKVNASVGGTKPKTAEHETYSALCIGARLLNPNTNYSLEDLTKASAIVDSSVNNPEDLFSNKMTQDWKDSCVMQTDVFFQNIPLTAKNVRIERQQEGPITKFLYTRADELIKELAANSEEFSAFNKLQSDKWNPGDIWVVNTSVTINNFADCKTIRHLNEKIYELWLSKKLIPISLKKIDSQSGKILELKNSGGINFFGKYRGHTLGQENGFSFTNNNMKIKFTLVNNTTRTGECAVRTFTEAADISAEIEGLAAAGGKAGKTFIDKVLTSMNKPTIFENMGFRPPINGYKELDRQFDNDQLKVMTMFFDLSKKSRYGPQSTINTVEKFIAELQKKPAYKTAAGLKKYVRSKMQCASLAVIIESMNAKQKDELVDKMITYASSEIRQISSFHVKIGK